MAGDHVEPGGVAGFHQVFKAVLAQGVHGNGGVDARPFYLDQGAFGRGRGAVDIEDLTEEFVREYVFPMFRGNTVYEGEYLLGTSIARPLIAKRLVEIAEQTGKSIRLQTESLYLPDQFDVVLM